MLSDEVLVAIDPGVSTGVAYKMGDAYVTLTITDVDDLWDLLRDAKPNKVAVELFARSNYIDQNMIRTMETVGGVKAACRVLGIQCVHHRPQQRKSYIPDAKPLLRKGATPHELDALAHLLLFEDELKRGKHDR